MNIFVSTRGAQFSNAERQRTTSISVVFIVVTWNPCYAFVCMLKGRGSGRRLPRFQQFGCAERHKATPRVSYAFANVSAARMASSITVNVGFALPEDGKTEALATLRLGMR
jgi:hypothetical protein